MQLADWLRVSDRSMLRLPDTPGAWNALADEAIRDGLAGLILEQARALGIELPPHTLDRLREASLAVAAGNLRYEAELSRVVRAFNHAEIPVMLLKGAALNHTVYDRPDLRPMSDLDLLVRPHDAERSLGLLADHGCRRGFDLLRDDFFPEYHYEVELFTSSPAPVRIDLHARPLRPLRVSQIMPDDGLWRDAEIIQVGDGEASVPRPEFMLIHLAAHAAFHGCGRLLWLHDLKRLVGHYEGSLDWQLFASRAREWRLSWAVLQALRRATELLGPFCPRGVIDDLATHRVSWRDRLALAQAPRDAGDSVAHVAVDLLCTPSVRFRTRYLLALLLPGRAHLAGLYPHRHWGWPACAHAWRLLRAVARATLGPIGLLAHVVQSAGRQIVHRILESPSSLTEHDSEPEPATSIHPEVAPAGR